MTESMQPISSMAGSLDDLGGTIRQTEEAVGHTRDLSIPKGVEESAGAPRVPGYMLTKLLGEGGFGQVWQAWQVRTRRHVAIKLFTRRGGVNWLLLQREVEKLVNLAKHPHIVSLLDADLSAEPPFYAMDLLAGGSLERFVREGGSVIPARAVAWMEQSAQALDYVHGKGIIHCDLKPANLLLDEDDRVRVADFGQSRVLSESGVLGTLFYMAPEQAVVAKAGSSAQPDIRWDLYGLGATFYAILTGKVPYADYHRGLADTGDLDQRLERYRAIVTRWPLKPCAEMTRGRVDTDLSAIIARCTAVEAAGRYGSSAALLADLKAWRERRPVSPLARSVVYRTRKHLARNWKVVGIVAFAGLVAGGAYMQSLVKGYAIQRMQDDLKQAEAKLRKYQEPGG